MIRARALLLAGLATGVIAPAGAQAQTALPRVYLTLGGGTQAAGSSFTDRREFDVNAERGTSEARHPFRTGALVDGGGGVRLWRRLGAGIGVSQFSARGVAAVDARIPHPFQFGAHREVRGETGRAGRTETGVHIQLLYQLPPRGRLRGVLFAGPSYLTARHDLVRDVRYDESYPYDTATFASAELARAGGSGFGFNAGADAFWMFTTRFGAGALVRMTRATIDLGAAGNRRVPIDAGGLHVAVGGRASF